MDGDPGLGKSAAVLDLAARVSPGSPFPDGTHGGGGAGGGPGEISVMGGDRGRGRSAAVLDLAARVSTGSPFPDGTKCGSGAGGVVVLFAEDGLADTIKPRPEAAGADTS